MKIRFIRSVLVAGIHHGEGSEAELDSEVCAELIGMGKALPAKSNRAVGLKDSDTKSTKTRKRKG